MPKINQEEYEVLKELDDKWKWIARDGNAFLWAYSSKPYKGWLGWGDMPISDIEFVSIDKFQFIQWEDSEPHNIQELIEEYESEETEVKTLESIREEIWEEMLRLEDKRINQWVDIRYQTLREVLQKLGHIDEPEVLSQDWIDWHKEFVGKRPDGTRVEVVKEKYLQNLLVPKQGEVHEYAQGWADGIAEYVKDLESGENLIVIEKPTIPQFVADWIEEKKPYNSLRVAFEYIAQRKRNNHADELASWVYEDNSETLARAWLDGYEVAEEQKYYVLDKEGHLLIRGFSNGNVDRVGDKMKPDNYPDWNKKNLPLTEQEIKDYDPRFWPFAVKVEELEE